MRHSCQNCGHAEWMVRICQSQELLKTRYIMIKVGKRPGTLRNHAITQLKGQRLTGMVKAEARGTYGMSGSVSQLCQAGG